MTHPYADILDLPYPFPTDRPRMSEADRAAQFSPFAALTGYEESIRETARRTDRKIELSEDAKKELNQKLVTLHEHPELTASFTYFEPDLYKKGGAYLEATGKVTKIDTVQDAVWLDNGTGIWMEDIADITIEE